MPVACSAGSWVSRLGCALRRTPSATRSGTQPEVGGPWPRPQPSFLAPPLEGYVGSPEVVFILCCELSTGEGGGVQTPSEGKAWGSCQGAPHTHPLCGRPVPDSGTTVLDIHAPH